MWMWQVTSSEAILEKESLSSKADLLKACGMPPALKKETVKVSMIQMIGGAIIYILNIIMHRKDPVTHLHYKRKHPTLMQHWFTSPDVECYNIGCHPILHRQHWVALFSFNLGFFHPMLMPTLALTLISKVFFAKLGSFTQYCLHQHWVVQKQHVFRSLLGSFTQCCCTHQHWGANTAWF